MTNANELLCEDIEIIDDTLVEGTETFYALLETDDPDVVFDTKVPGTIAILAPGFTRIFILDDESMLPYC